MRFCICSDEFNDSDGSISLDGDEDEGSDIFDSEDDEDEDELSDVDVSDPEDEPKAKRMKPVSSKDFQKKLKKTSSKIDHSNEFDHFCFIVSICSIFQI